MMESFGRSLGLILKYEVRAVPNGGFAPEKAGLLKDSLLADWWNAVTGRGVKRKTSAFHTSGVISCRKEMSSRIQTPRPCVPMIKAFSRGWTAMSWTATVGRLDPLRGNQVSPLSSE